MEYLNVNEAAKLLGIHPNTLRKYDWVPYYRLKTPRADRRYLKQDILDHIESCRIDPRHRVGDEHNKGIRDR